MGSSKKQTVGYWYHPAIHMVLGKGPIDAVLRIRGGDVDAWTGEATGNSTITIDNPNLWGGEEAEGGIQGDIDLMFGAADQMPNPAISSLIGPDPSAHRGHAALLFKGGRYGAMNPYPKPLSVMVKRILKGWEDDACWYPEKAAIQFAGDAGDPAVALGEASVGVAATAGSIFASDRTTIGWVFPVGYGLARTMDFWLKPPPPDVAADNLPRRIVAFDGDTDAEVWDTGWVGKASHEARLNEILAEPENVHLAAPFTAGDNLRETVTLARVPSFIKFTLYGCNTLETEGAFHVGFQLLIPASASSQVFGINPAHAIYYSLTAGNMQGEPVELINDASFRAAADRFYDEDFALCTDWDPDKETVEQFRQRICNVVAANCTRSTVNGQWYLDPVRGDYDIGALPVLTDDDILNFEAEPSLLDDAVNQVAVKWFDPLTKQARTTAPLHALGAVEASGINAETIDYSAIPVETLALRTTERELRARSTPLWRYTLTTNRKPYNWRLGTYFRLQAPKRGIADSVCLVGDIGKGTLRSGAISLVATQDVFAMPESTYVVGQPPIEPPDTLPVSPQYQAAFEAPYAYVAGVVSAADLGALEPDAGYVLVVGAQPPVGINYQLYTRPGAGDYEDAGRFDWCPTAVIAEAGGISETNFTLEQGRSLDRVAVGTAALWGEELVRIDAFDALTGTVVLGRGCGDTVAAVHLAGERIWFFDEWSGTDGTEYATGELAQAKVLTRTGTDQLPLEGSPAVDTLMDQRAFRPYPPAALRLNGEAAPDYLTGLVSVTWAHRDRIAQADQLIDDAVASVGPEPGTTYTLRWYRDDMLETTQSGLTGDTSTYSPVGDGLVRVELEAARDGVVSWQRQMRNFAYTATAAEAWELQDDSLLREQNNNPIYLMG